jgi:hypothetical protein
MRILWHFLITAIVLNPLIFAQTSPVTVLQIETGNNVRYIYDTPDFAAYATQSGPVNQTFPTFATWITEADIVAVNGKAAKGVYLTRQAAVNLSPNPAPGQGVADLVVTNIVDRILVLLQADGTPIGSIMMLGLDGGNPPPGAPSIARQGNFAITGGTGAFLGVRGQFVSGPLIDGAIANRSASVKEDPSRRRINGGGRAVFVLHLIPMTRPEILSDQQGPAIYHNDFSPVTELNPAKKGEVLILAASNLGPTRPGVDPGVAFPASGPLQEVNSPVEVFINGRPAEVVNKIGWPGRENVYRVDFRLPPDTVPGYLDVRLAAAWVRSEYTASILVE